MSLTIDICLLEVVAILTQKETTIMKSDGGRGRRRKKRDFLVLVRIWNLVTGQFWPSQSMCRLESVNYSHFVVWNSWQAHSTPIKPTGSGHGFTDLLVGSKFRPGSNPVLYTYQ